MASGRIPGLPTSGKPGAPGGLLTLQTGSVPARPFVYVGGKSALMPSFLVRVIVILPSPVDIRPQAYVHRFAVRRDLGYGQRRRGGRRAGVIDIVSAQFRAHPQQVRRDVRTRGPGEGLGTARKR